MPGRMERKMDFESKVELSLIGAFFLALAGTGLGIDLGLWFMTIPLGVLAAFLAFCVLGILTKKNSKRGAN